MKSSRGRPGSSAGIAPIGCFLLQGASQPSAKILQRPFDGSPRAPRLFRDLVHFMALDPQQHDLLVVLGKFTKDILDDQAQGREAGLIGLLAGYRVKMVSA